MSSSLPPADPPKEGALLVADAPHLLYRAFYALPDSIKMGDGRPGNALLGATNMLLNVLDEYKPRAIVACFGQEAADYRAEAYPSYHASRPPVPDDLEHQWQFVPGLWEALGWSVQTSPDLEADDLMGSLAIAETAAGGHTLILTGDRDMFQCASPSVTVLLQQARSRGPTPMGPAEVVERYGIRPEQVPDFIALRGDPSDGLPGAKGIGEKTAAEILKRHETLESAIEGAIREKPSVRRALLEQTDEIRMFKDIATLRDAEVDRPPDMTTNYAGGAEFALEIGMKRLSERLAGMASSG